MNKVTTSINFSMKATGLLLAFAVLLVSCGPRAPRQMLSDEALLDTVERCTIKYFTEFADPATGLARERNNDRNGNIVTIGGSGFGMMAVIAGAERGYYPKAEGIERIGKMVGSLEKLERFHGAWAHWYDADSGKPFSFSEFDDGGDLVEARCVALRDEHAVRLAQPAHRVDRLGPLRDGHLAKLDDLHHLVALVVAQLDRVEQFAVGPGELRDQQRVVLVVLLLALPDGGELAGVADQRVASARLRQRTDPSAA